MGTIGRAIVLAVTAAVAVAMIILILLFRFWLPPTQKKTAVPPYTIGCWQGQVAVFEGDKAYPMQVFDTSVYALPPEAQKQVQEGIPVEDADHLSVLLEDYTS